MSIDIIADLILANLRGGGVKYGDRMAAGEG